MSDETVKLLGKIEQAIETIVRRRGKRSAEYLQAMREYQSILGRAMCEVKENVELQVP